ncbi:GNAT family N-acetyltransferase [Roseivirga sp. BDSF3-8]|uniref:GNAT family N-acetyltransferase n=1 Tax=Roseivirga sp. BDSF3-8 TaxID=3241598 RepID=UPI003531BC0C
MLIEVVHANTPDQLSDVFSIRERVFVEEQEVSREDEYDQFEDTSTHFLAMADGKPAGTARWRFTEKGIKLERFAVDKPYRGKGVGAALVQAVMDNISQHPEAKGRTLYLHSQLKAMPLYARFGFKKKGEMFEECGIQHFTMATAIDQG